MFAGNSLYKVVKYTEEQSSYAARNYGVGLSKGHILLFTDIDCILTKEWAVAIDRETKNISQKDVLLATGFVQLFPREKDYNPYEWYDFKFSLNQYNYSIEKTGATANLIVTRSAFDLIGGFNPIVSGGDRDFCRRLNIKGASFKYINDAVVLHPARSSFFELKSKASRIAKGLAVLNTKNKSVVHVIKYAIKTMIASIIQIKQYKTIVDVFFNNRFTLIWKVKYLFIALHLGFIARTTINYYVVKYYFNKSRND